MSVKINSKDIYNLLKNKGVKNLFHANTVRTSLSFIKEKALLSREYVEQNGLIQTEQYTDEKDKKHGIWDSVFLDGYDLHQAYGINHYGPVLFVMRLDLLLSPDFPIVRATKSNPSNWSAEPRFHDSVQEINEKYLAGEKFDKSVDGNIMFLLDSPGNKISLDKFCEKIILDDPKVFTSAQTPVYDLVNKTLRNALDTAGLKTIPIERRHKDDTTRYCHQRYQMMAMHNIEKFNKLFSKAAKPT